MLEKLRIIIGFLVFEMCSVISIFQDVPVIMAWNGTSLSLPCHFPFKYNNTWHYTCLTANSFHNDPEAKWCSVRPIYTGRYPHNLFGFCEITAVKSNFATIAGNGKGKSCVFPFIYKSRYHYTCIKSSNRKRLTWCSTTENYDLDKIWGYCKKNKTENLKDCYDKDSNIASYRGITSHTKSGNLCLNWKMSIYGWMNSEHGLGDHNFCRNPDNDTNGPWCYIHSHNTNNSFDYCDIPKCVNKDILSQTCTKTKFSPSQLKVYGGKLVSEASPIPWQVALYHKREKKIECGGTLIATCYVITAAHCFKKSGYQEYDVRIGYDQNKQLTQVAEIKALYVHPSYNPVHGRTHDIALIKLADPCATTSEFVSPICLPTFDKQFVEGDTCMISGWGKAEDVTSQELRYADVPVHSNAVCMQESIYGNQIKDSMLCAGYMDGRVDSCQGDSGSPLACQDRTTKSWHLWGVVSWGEKCGSGINKPGVYTRISSYLKWINCIVDGHPNYCES